MDELKPSNGRKLKSLVYASLAGGMVGVCGVSAFAHGNASPMGAAHPEVSWNSDDFVVTKPATTDVKAIKK